MFLIGAVFQVGGLVLIPAVIYVFATTATTKVVTFSIWCIVVGPHGTMSDTSCFSRGWTKRPRRSFYEKRKKTSRSFLAEANGSRTHPSGETQEATGFEDREGHRAPFASRSGPSDYPPSPRR